MQVNYHILDLTKFWQSKKLSALITTKMSTKSARRTTLKMVGISLIQGSIEEAHMFTWFMIDLEQIWILSKVCLEINRSLLH